MAVSGDLKRARARQIAALGECELEIEIDKIVSGGSGLGRHHGIPILVDRAAPGDRLRVAVTERHPDFARARLLEVLRPGPGRRTPPCPHYERCGGCDLQHLDERSQVEAKVNAALETLRRLGSVATRFPFDVHLGASLGYRLRTQLQVDPATRRVGYFARGSHQLEPVDRCPILVPALEQLLSELPGLLPESPPRRLDLAASEGRLSCAPLVPGLPHGELELRVGPDRLQFDARCFVQAHRDLVGTLVGVAVGEWRGTGVAFDLYAGIGLFTVPLARRYQRVAAVEEERAATFYARRNLRRNGCRNAEVHHLRVERFVERIEPGCDRVVVDPPRAGLDDAVRRGLLERAPARLTYVSCQPPTLARDLRDLLAAYTIERVDFVDLFPQTSHLETVVQLVKS